MTKTFHEFAPGAIKEFLESANSSFEQRLNAWRIDVFDKETNEVIGGLMARQLSLASSLAESPISWNVHILPVVLRCMADVYITFCWILKDRKPRSHQFIEYGLGQEKLAIEKYKEALSEELVPDPDALEHVRIREEMLEAERASYLIPVNLGSWSEMKIRDMAIEVGEKKFYDLVFAQFSSAVHSTWQHIWRWNLKPCSNPLHMGHRTPFDPQLSISPELYSVAVKYLCKTFAKFDREVLGRDTDNDAYRCYEVFCDRFAEKDD